MFPLSFFFPLFFCPFVLLSLFILLRFWKDLIFVLPFVHFFCFLVVLSFCCVIPLYVCYSCFVFCLIIYCFSIFVFLSCYVSMFVFVCLMFLYCCLSFCISIFWCFLL